MTCSVITGLAVELQMLRRTAPKVSDSSVCSTCCIALRQAGPVTMLRFAACTTLLAALTNQANHTNT
eukprot:5411-Heterococcus_DN1.PRE.2